MIARSTMAAFAAVYLLLPASVAPAQEVPEIRPGDTIIFQPLGQNGQCNFNDIENIFDMDLAQVKPSDDPTVALIDPKGTPDEVLLKAKMKPDAMNSGIKQISFWCVVHDWTMSGVLTLAAPAADKPREFHIKGLRNLTWVLNDGQRDYVLPKVQVQGTPAMTAGCHCMQMMSGGMGGMGQRGMMQPDDQGGMSMPGMEGMVQRIMPEGMTPRSTRGGMCGMCGGGATGSAGGNASGFCAFPQQRAAAGNQPGDKTLLAGAEELFRTNALLMPAQSTPKVSIIATGIILRVDPRTRSINLNHAPIPAINWPAMTMDFAVGPEVDLSNLKAGQWVEFTMEPQSGGGDSYTITQVRAKGSAGVSANELEKWSGQEPGLFTLQNLSSSEVALSAYLGKPVIVHFFATWCGPCREEMEGLRRFVSRTKNDDLSVLAISVGEPEGRVRRFFDTMPVNFTVLLDHDKTIARAWRIATLPTTYVLSPELKPKLFLRGELQWDQLDVAQIVKKLDEANQEPGQPVGRRLTAPLEEK